MQNFSHEEAIKNTSELEFVLFCIENIAARLGIEAQRVYQALTVKSNILHAYVVPEYEPLHTQGKDYIINDILEVIRENGVEI